MKTPVEVELIEALDAYEDLHGAYPEFIVLDIERYQALMASLAARGGRAPRKYRGAWVVIVGRTDRIELAGFADFDVRELTEPTHGEGWRVRRRL